MQFDSILIFRLRPSPLHHQKMYQPVVLNPQVYLMRVHTHVVRIIIQHHWLVLQGQYEVRFPHLL